MRKFLIPLFILLSLFSSCSDSHQSSHSDDSDDVSSVYDDPIVADYTVVNVYSSFNEALEEEDYVKGDNH